MQEEMAEERSSMMAMMSSLARLRKLFAAKGACLDAAIGAGEAACDCGAGSRIGAELVAAHFKFRGNAAFDADGTGRRAG